MSKQPSSPVHAATDLKDLSLKVRRKITIFYANHLLVLKQGLVLGWKKLPFGATFAIHKPELLIGETAQPVSKLNLPEHEG